MVGALALGIALGKLCVLLSGNRFGLAFTAAQIFAQLCGKALLARQFVIARAHRALHGDFMRLSQAWLDFRSPADNSARLTAEAQTLLATPRGAEMACRGSSVVERTLGKGEAESSILSRGTIFLAQRPSGRAASSLSVGFASHAAGAWSRLRFLRNRFGAMLNVSSDRGAERGTSARLYAARQGESQASRMASAWRLRG